MAANFEELLAEARQVSGEGLWRGTFRDYYERVKQTPGIVQNAHQRLYHAIVRHGVEEIETSSDKRLFRIYGGRARKLLRYKFFENEFFGLDLVIMRIMEFLKAGRQWRRGVTPDPLLHRTGRLGQDLHAGPHEAGPGTVGALLCPGRLPDP